MTGTDIRNSRVEPHAKPGRIASIPAGRRTKWLVVGFWVVVVAIALPLSFKLKAAEKNDTSAWLPARAESTRVLNLEARLQSPNIVPAVVVYERPSGLTAADLAKAAADARRFASLPGVGPGKVAGPIQSADHKAMETIIQVNLGTQGWKGAPAADGSIRAIAQLHAGGLVSHVTGVLGNAAASESTFNGIDGKLLFSAIAVVIVILLFTYRSPVLWLFPIIVVGFAVFAAEAVIYLLAAHAGLTVNAQSAGILYVVLIGAGTDYALLIVARYREELRRHDRRDLAMAEALRRAGPAIIASGSTVILAMLTLLVASLQSTKGLGPVLAIGVAVSLAAMTTLLPALLVIFPRGVFWPYRPAYGSAEPTTAGIWARMGRRIAGRPRVTWISTAAILGVLAIGMIGLRTGGLTDAQSYRNYPDSVIGASVLARHFPAGSGDPVVVVGASTAASRLRTAFTATEGITGVTPPVTRAGHVFLLGTLASPPDSQAAYATINRLRSAVHAIAGAHAQVGGNTAINLDELRAAAHDRNILIPLILVVVFVIIALLLRAVVAPVILIATVVLSFTAALGVSAFAFSHVFGFAGSDPSFPLFAFVFLVALGVDYNIFLMTRVREEARRTDARRGALTGLAATGGVITSAGIVLAGTFAVLAVIPLTLLTELGFTIAFGILLDTIIVRSILVTALNLDLGRRMWWPSRLARRPDPALGELGEDRARVLTAS